MRINYTIKAEDYLKFQLFIASRSKQVKRRRRFALYLIPILYLLLGIIFYFIKDISGFIVFAGFAILWFIFYPIFSRKRYIRFYRKHIEEHYSANFDKEFYIELGEKQLHLKSVDAESKLDYSTIAEINDLGTHLIIHLKAGSAVILPKQNCDMENIDEFVKVLSQKSEKELTDLTDWVWK